MRYRLLALALIAAGPIATANAATFVVSGYSTSSGGAGSANLLGTSDSPYKTSQWDFSAATLAQKTGSLPVGAIITGVALRLATQSTTITSDITFDQFNISIGSSIGTIGALDRTFTNNEGADTILARSGALTIAGGSFVKGSTSQRPGAFYSLSFDTPYTYTGGDLLVTMDSHLTSPIATGAIYMDAFSSIAYNKIDFNSSFGSTTPSTRGTAEFFYQPVLALTYSLPAAVPEPATWLSAILGFGMIGATVRRKGMKLRRA